MALTAEQMSKSSWMNRKDSKGKHLSCYRLKQEARQLDISPETLAWIRTNLSKLQKGSHK